MLRGGDASGVNWLSEIRDRLSTHVATSVEAPADFRKAGVVAPLYVKENELWVLFTKRTENVETHRGQVSFPGGAHEPGDATLKETALRETEEEIGIPRDRVVVLGALSPIVTITNFYVEPFVAAIPHPMELKPSPAEIDEIWEIPVAALLAPTAVEERFFPGRSEAVLFYHYGPKTVWGATARILSELLGVLAAGREVSSRA
jgi:8-oxo-dGTP pyrophosphatase MutT (NUDIX family)